MAKIAIVATIEVAQERRDEFRDLLMSHRTRCLRDEPGTLQFAVLAPRESDTAVLTCEIYRDDAAFAVHRHGPSLAQSREETAKMFTCVSVNRCSLVESSVG